VTFWPREAHAPRCWRLRGARDFHLARSSERSPLHDVRKPATSILRCDVRNSCFRTSQISRWWSQTGSNRRPPACKAGALPTELWPRSAERLPVSSSGASREVVGLGRLELPTSRLSSARSNQLSYKPKTGLPLSRARARERPKSRATGDDPQDRTRSHCAHGAGSSKKKEKRRRRSPANGHLRPEPQCPDVSKRSDSDCVMQPLKDHP
jgi:hypothetical protein